MNTESRRSRAHAAMVAAIVASANLDALVAVLRATPAQSADDRPDDLCAVSVRGPLTDADVLAVEGRPEGDLRRVYGAALDAPRVWRHSWLRRRVSRSGVKVVLEREAWLAENATAILRNGGVEVRTYSPATDYVRVVAATDAELRAVALTSLDGDPSLLAREEQDAKAWLDERLARPHTAEQRKSWEAAAHHRLFTARQAHASLL